MNVTEYKKTVFATTDNVQIVLMLYDGALKQLYWAKKKIGKGDIAAKCPHLGKVTSIVTELSNVLDMEKGGEIARNLRNLYDYSIQRLLYANLRNDIRAIEDVERVIGELREGWKEMMEGLKKRSQSP